MEPSPVHRRRGLWLAGPIVFGASAWLAAGTVAIGGEAGTTARVGMLPPVWWLVPLACAAALVPAFRRHPATTLPSLLSTLPWWPLPLPAAALLWTGRLAWVPVLLTLISALRWPPDGSQTSAEAIAGAAARSDAAGEWRRPVVLAAACTAVAACLVAWSLAPRLPLGDEWHYLMITQSLRKDGDLRIENNHQQRDYRSFYSGTLPPDFLQRGKDGEIYSIHAPGVSALVLPLFAAFGYTGAQITMIIVASLTGGLIWLIGWLATRDRASAWFAWASVTGSITFLVQSVTVFPDGPGALCVAAAVVLLLRLGVASAGVSPRALVTVSVMLAALPWLHTRFVLLAAGLAMLIVWNIVRQQGGAFAGASRSLALFLIVPAISALAWFGYFVWIYGTPNPAAPYGSNPETRLAYIPGGVAGLLFDQQFGLLTYAPVLAAAGAGWILSSSRSDRPLRMGAPALALYLAGVGTYWMWWAGVPATPARFFAAALPILAAPAAVAWKRATPVGRSLWSLLLAVSLGLSVLVVGLDHGRLAWNVRGPEAEWITWLHPVVDAYRIWPSFFWKLTPGDVSTERLFAAHILVWTGLAAAAAMLTVAFVRRKSGAIGAALAPIVWPVALMLVATVSWPLVGAPALRTDHAQVDLWRAMANAGSSAAQTADGAIEIVPFGGWRRPQPGLLVMSVPRLAVEEGVRPGWSVRGLPAGEFLVHVRTRRPATGGMSVELGPEARPLRSLPLQPTQDQELVLALPAGADQLTLRFDPETTSSIDRLTMAVRSLGAGVNGTLPISGQLFGADEIYFLDDKVFIEHDAFWVKAEQTTRFVVVRHGTSKTITLELGNGGVANRLGLAVNGTASELQLAASEVRTLSVPLDAGGCGIVTIHAPSGFRPSDSGGSSDSRYLGVRVRVLD